jgi:hypothetical protein
MGAPGKNTSLSGNFSTVGKLCVISAFYLGKHRGLPAADDPVIDFDFHHLKEVLDTYDDEHEEEDHVSVGVGDVEIISEEEKAVNQLRERALMITAARPAPPATVIGESLDRESGGVFNALRQSSHDAHEEV